jgi:glycosyltransferase involved in cell wall biosynthesis
MRKPRIGFIGSMNAMPMAYALKFRRDGHDVRYVVETERQNHLMRPEHQYPSEISYPYPSWVVEIPWIHTPMKQASLPWSNRAAVRAMADRDVVFLNDYGIALAPFMPRQAVCIALSSGADIDLSCRWDMALSFAGEGRRKWLYAARLLLLLWCTHVQRRGLRKCDMVCYFPRGLNPAGDAVIAGLARSDGMPRVFERYDVNFTAAGAKRLPVAVRPLRNILVPVRVKLRPSKGGEIEYKGNDLILRALARYRQRQPELEIHLFEKGGDADLALAHQMCRDLGLEDCVTWHDTMPLAELMQLYADCDVCFDQVGSHWIGAVGCLALYTGRPLIANARLDVFARIWGPDPPILNATTVDEIFDQLVRCEDIAFRERIAERGHTFAGEFLDTEAVYQRLLSAVLELWTDRQRNLAPMQSSQ